MNEKQGKVFMGHISVAVSEGSQYSADVLQQLYNAAALRALEMRALEMANEVPGKMLVDILSDHGQTVTQLSAYEPLSMQSVGRLVGQDYPDEYATRHFYFFFQEGIFCTGSLYADDEDIKYQDLHIVNTPSGIASVARTILNLHDFNRIVCGIKVEEPKE